MIPTDTFRILLVALHYGKEGSGGARRSFLWAKGLRQMGHKVTVVSPYVEVDHPDDIHIPHPVRSNFQAGPVQPPGFLETHVKRRIRPWLRWPDAEITWHKMVLKTLSTREQSYDWIMTTSPPESAHRIGYKLAKISQAKWCVELRDGWLVNSHRPYVRGFRKFLEGRLARHWLKHADAVTAVDAETLAEAVSLTPNLPNAEIGHFSEAFSGKAEALSAETFNLVHAGGFSLSDRRRSLSSLLDAMVDAFENRADLQLHLIGPLSSAEIETLKPYKDRVTAYGQVSLERSRAIQAGSDAVLLYTPLSGSTALPGKYSEYCCIRKPIVFMGSDLIRAKAHRRAEFFELADLAHLAKNIEMAEETKNTVSAATQKLEALLKSAF